MPFRQTIILISLSTNAKGSSLGVCYAGRVRLRLSSAASKCGRSYQNNAKVHVFVPAAVVKWSSEFSHCQLRRDRDGGGRIDRILNGRPKPERKTRQRNDLYYIIVVR